MREGLPSATETVVGDGGGGCVEGWGGLGCSPITGGVSMGDSGTQI